MCDGDNLILNHSDTVNSQTNLLLVIQGLQSCRMGEKIKHRAILQQYILRV